MKKIIGIVVLVIIAGSFLSGCISAPEPVEPETWGLTAKGLQVKADVAERQARGFIQYSGDTGKFASFPLFIGESNTLTIGEMESYGLLEMSYI